MEHDPNYLESPMADMFCGLDRPASVDDLHKRFG